MNLWDKIKYYHLLLFARGYDSPSDVFSYTSIDPDLFVDNSDIDTSGWDIRKVVDISDMFSGCAKLELGTINWDFSRVSMYRTIQMNKFGGTTALVNRYIQLLIELGVHNNHFPDFIWSKYDVGSGSSKFDKFLDKERVDLGQVLLSVDLTLTDFFVLNNQAFFLLTPSDKPTLN